MAPIAVPRTTLTGRAVDPARVMRVPTVRWVARRLMVWCAPRVATAWAGRLARCFAMWRPGFTALWGGHPLAAWCAPLGSGVLADAALMWSARATLVMCRTVPGLIRALERLGLVRRVVRGSTVWGGPFSARRARAHQGTRRSQSCPQLAAELRGRAVRVLRGSRVRGVPGRAWGASAHLVSRRVLQV